MTIPMNRFWKWLRLPISAPVLTLAGMLLGLYIATFAYLQPPFDVYGDAPGYLEAMRVMNGSLPEPETFTPNRILTTFLSTGTVSLLGGLTGNYLASWFFVNTLYFFGLGFACFFLFRRVTRSDTGSIIGALFVAGNYDVLVFGLNYLMDLSGWFWFVLSLLFLFMHIDREGAEGGLPGRRYLWLAVLAAGIGGLFKEYAYIGLVPVGLFLLWEHGRSPSRLISRSVPLALAAIVPTLLVHAGVYLIYGYTYLDWYGMNASTFAWQGWLWNSARSFLVVLSFLLPIALFGLRAFVLEMRQERDTRRALFVATLVLPALAVLAWPIVTERLVFLIVPLAGLLAAYAVKRHERHWPWFGFIWLLYVVLAWVTDGLILSKLYAW